MAHAAAHARVKGAAKPLVQKGSREGTSTKTGRDSMSSTLVVRADRSFKTLIKRAAELRGISASDYVRVELKERAAKEIADAERGVLRLAADDQIALWRALQEPPVVTPALQRLGEQIRRHLS